MKDDSENLLFENASSLAALTWTPTLPFIFVDLSTICLWYWYVLNCLVFVYKNSTLLSFVLDQPRNALHQVEAILFALWKS